jgi:hypothetical protein
MDHASSVWANPVNRKLPRCRVTRDLYEFLTFIPITNMIRTEMKAHGVMANLAKCCRVVLFYVQTSEYSQL